MQPGSERVMASQDTIDGITAIINRHKSRSERTKAMNEKSNENQAAPPTEHILQFFAYEHLPVHLQTASQPFHALAHQIVADLPRNPERTEALRKLLEA